MRTRDYVPREFPRWVRDPRSYTVVAERDGRVVAVARSRLVTPDEAWGQGIRVDPSSQGLGIGQAITRHWPDVLYRRGARVARVAVLADNRASLGMMARSGFRIAVRMIRRGWWGQPLPSAREAAMNGATAVMRVRRVGPLWRRIQETAALGRSGGLVLAGDYYAALTRVRAAGYVRRGDAYVAGRAFCLVDRRRIGLPRRPGWWIVALGGPSLAAARLAREILSRAVRRGVRELWIDAGGDRRLIRALEGAGFTSPRSWGDVVIMEARLPLRSVS